MYQKANKNATFTMDFFHFFNLLGILQRKCQPYYGERVKSVCDFSKLIGL